MASLFSNISDDFIHLRTIDIRPSNFMIIPCDEIGVSELISNLNNHKPSGCVDITGFYLKNVSHILRPFLVRRRNTIF